MQDSLLQTGILGGFNELRAARSGPKSLYFRRRFQGCRVRVKSHRRWLGKGTAEGGSAMRQRHPPLAERDFL
jgi:hypothetical protein